MATLRSLLSSKNSCFSPRPFHGSKHALICNNLPRCSLHSDTPSPASTSSSRALDIIPVPSEKPFVRLGTRAGCLLGLGAVAGTMAAFPQHAYAAEIASSFDAWSQLLASEPKNALSLPTWVIHTASVAEWCVPLSSLNPKTSQIQQSFEEFQGLGHSTLLFSSRAQRQPDRIVPHCECNRQWESIANKRITAMALVWRYGDTPGNSTWKGLSWGMVPLLGGAMCACTWHFFYNAQSLEILVVIQAALTVIGNFTMWIAAFRIYQASQKQSKAP